MLAATKIVANKATRTAHAMHKTIVKTMTKRHRKGVPAPTKRALDVFVKPSHCDVNGSYTGKPIDIHETPVQDADDL